MTIRDFDKSEIDRDDDMNDFTRKNPLLSLCGLNCGLCTMQIGGHCPGCGQGNKPCKAARCGMEHGVEYCFECSEYPCQIYEHSDEYDSFITHRNQKTDMKKEMESGIDAYTAEQREKVRLLNELLQNYNSGREKTLFSIAVNLLDVEDIKNVLETADRETEHLTPKEKAVFISNHLRQLGNEKAVIDDKELEAVTGAGEYIEFADSDDYEHPRTYEESNTAKKKALTDAKYLPLIK